MSMLTLLDRVLFITLGLIIGLLINKSCKKEKVITEKVVIHKQDTVIKVDTLKVVNDYVRMIIKRDTVKLKPETLFLLNLRKWTFSDSILSLEFIANYVDSSSLTYKLKLKPVKITKEFNNYLSVNYSFSSISFIYSRRVIGPIFISAGISKFDNNYIPTIGIGLRW